MKAQAFGMTPETSFDEHAVAIRKKAVTLGDGVFVGAENILASGEGADQH
jgi:hypothetical protein